MKKLRLIKPWGLRTVRQHLDNVIPALSANTVFTACAGPAHDNDDHYGRFESADVRIANAQPMLSTAAPMYNDDMLRGNMQIAR